MNFLISFSFFLFQFLGLIIPLLLGMAYATLLERKSLSSFQRRKGPNVVGLFGLLQPLADGLKLFLKENIFPSQVNFFIFVLAPVLMFMLSLVSWSVIPFEKGVVYADISLGVLFLFAISSLAVYGVIMAGWSSNSRYPFLGALRSTSQMVSYEVSIGIITISLVLCTGSLNLTKIVLAQEFGWYIFPLWPSFLMFFISGLAETSRLPFDLPEAEAELVSGYNVEYSAMGFALFFLGEYSHMILMSVLISLFFLGGWTIPFFVSTSFFSTVGFFVLGIKTTFVLFSFIWVRATFPRYRYDQLMRLGWKVFLPLSFGWLLFIASFLYLLNYLSVLHHAAFLISNVATNYFFSVFWFSRQLFGGSIFWC
jgi:NADH-quinone oxidoreductase subunit H